MKSHSSLLSSKALDLGRTDQVINFYYSDEERRRTLLALAPLPPGEGLVLATPRQELGFFSEPMRKRGIPIVDINLVEITTDWRRAISNMLDAMLHSLQSHRSVRLLADFDGSVHLPAIYELEALLRAASRDWRVPCVTQYDARIFTEAIDVPTLRRHAVVLIGSFYDRTVETSRNSSTEEAEDAFEPQDTAAD